MSIKSKLDEDLKAAMKARDALRLNCLRMLKSKILEKEVELRVKRGVDYLLSDDEVIEVASSYAKQRRDSIESYRKGGREDLAAKEEAELAIIEDYLPQQLSREEIEEIVRRAIEESGAASIKDMGAVMKVVMPQVKGRADGKAVNQIVRDELSPQATHT
jgi:uncharacterized protein YqeY